MKHFYNRRETDVQKRRRQEQNSMVRTRILLGSMALGHALSALFLPTHSSLFILSSVWSLTYWFPVLLGVISSAMIAAALAEHWGYSQRSAHEASAALLAVMWAIVWAYSWEGGADYITFIAPVHIFFIGWSVIAEAQVQRTRVVQPTVLVEE